MIDIHTHIIPKVDDGANEYKESYEMLKRAYEMGFTDIIATSHYMDGNYVADAKKREELIESLNSYLKDNNINIKLYLGNEIYIVLDILKLIEEGKASTLANSRYVLFEIPMNTNVLFFNECIFELKSKGYIPILAHPERYKVVKENPNIVSKWLERGLLMQSNYTSIIGEYGNEAKKTVKKLLKSNMVQFLGTDAHSEGKYEKVKEAIKQIEKCIGKEKLEELTTINPRHIINDEEIKVEGVKPIRKGWF